MFSGLFNNVLAEDKTNPTIGIISLYDSQYANTGKYSDWNKEDYAKKHNYGLFLNQKLLDNSRSLDWNKIFAIQKY